MTTSPYDNLPVGRDISAGTQDEHDSGSGSTPHYTEVTAAPGYAAGGAVSQPAADRDTGQDTAPANGTAAAQKHGPAGAQETAKEQTAAVRLQQRDVQNDVQSDASAGSSDADTAVAEGTNGYSGSNGLARLCRSGDPRGGYRSHHR